MLVQGSKNEKLNEERRNIVLPVPDPMLSRLDLNSIIHLSVIIKNVSSIADFAAPANRLNIEPALVV